MSHTPHELADEFPDAIALIHRLKQEDRHFAGLADDHHRINREIHRIESGIDAAGDERLELLKKQRLALLDEIGGWLASAAREGQMS